MEKEKLGQEPAFGFGFKEEIPTPWSSLHSTQIVLKRHEGMSKRFYAACEALQGILANQNGEYAVIDGTNQRYTEHLISQAYQFADELLKQEQL